GAARPCSNALSVASVRSISCRKINIERSLAPAIAPPPASAGDVNVSEDDGAEREVDAGVAHPVSGLTVQHTAGGGLVIQSPPDTALTLAALFSGMAQFSRLPHLRR